MIGHVFVALSFALSFFLVPYHISVMFASDAKPIKAIYSRFALKRIDRIALNTLFALFSILCAEVFSSYSFAAFIVFTGITISYINDLVSVARISKSLDLE